MDAFSRRTRLDIAENALTRAVSAARARGHDLLDLSDSNPTRVGLSLEAASVNRALSDARVGQYAPQPFGLLEARAALSHLHASRGLAIAPEDIMLTSSTSEAYGYLFKLLCDPGDAVLVPAPSYPLLDVLAELENVRIIPYYLRYDGEWHLDRSLVALAQSTGARAIIAVHPNNPTGSFTKRAELAILAECGLPVVSDEVFGDYAFAPDARRAPSLLELEDTLVFSMGGLSKALLLPQLKLAWTSMQGPRAKREAVRARLEHIADAYLSPSISVQLGLARLLAHGPALQARARERCMRNLTALKAACGPDAGLTVLSVEGGWYAILRLPHVLEDEAWALCLLDKDHVITQPGYLYELGRGAHLVLSLITPEPVFSAGALRIASRARAVCGAGA